MSKTLILGGGVTGLAAGLKTGFPVFEAQSAAGGICTSYYMRPGTSERLQMPPEDGEAYRFETGGGHWIFGGDSDILDFINQMAPLKQYQRSSGVFFAEQEIVVPYPIQHHLRFLDPKVTATVLDEIQNPTGSVETMAEWFAYHFGPTLNEIFFHPFHDLYTAGLFNSVAPLDPYKTPINIDLVKQGALEETPEVGYNVSFGYPEKGLGKLIKGMALQCNMRYEKRAVQIHMQANQIRFEDGTSETYDQLVSTLPLNKCMELAGLEVDEEPDPYTSVLVLNIGAISGPELPMDHWLYVPKTKSGFHRIGFYSNVDASFLPVSGRNGERVSIYVERAYANGEKPSDEEIKEFSDAVVEELKAWEFIHDVEVLDPTWIDVAYTWRRPNSQWSHKALLCLKDQNIISVGRYGQWHFQGIADSIRDGFKVAESLA